MGVLIALFALICGIGIGIGLYHYALGSAGWLGRKAAGQAEKQLKKIGKGILGIEDPVPGKQSRIRYGKYKNKKRSDR